VSDELTARCREALLAANPKICLRCASHAAAPMARMVEVGVYNVTGSETEVREAMLRAARGGTE